LLKIEIERLKKGYLESDTKYLKKKLILTYEYHIIHKFRSKYYIDDLCQLLNLYRSGYYRWLKRLERKTKQESYKDSLKTQIKVYHEMYPTKGYRSIRREIIKDSGWLVSFYMMYQCFKELGIASKA
jgi:hypothetical protein